MSDRHAGVRAVGSAQARRRRRARIRRACGSWRTCRAARERGRDDFRVAEGAALVAVDLVVLVSLAGDQHDVALARIGHARRGSRARDRARCETACRPGCPAAMSATMACGDSVRGLSSVITMSSASSAAMPPMSGRLPGSRSPPQPNTTASRPAAVGARRAQRFPQRVRRVRVVDHRERRVCAAEGLHASRRGMHARQRARGLLGRESPVEQHRDDGEQVVDVEVAHQRARRARRYPSSSRTRCRMPCDASIDVHRAHEAVGAAHARLVAAAGHDEPATTARIHRELPAERVVDVDDARRRAPAHANSRALVAP